MKYYHLDPRISVVQNLKVKGCRIANRGELREKDAKNELPEFLERYKTRIIEIVKIDDFSFALVDKATSHSLYEGMLIDASDNFSFSLFDYPENVKTSVFRIIASMFSTAEEQMRLMDRDSNISFAFNYDPFTYDRPTIMTEKRFHFHVCCYGKKELERVSKEKVFADTKNISIFRQHRLLDPISFVFTDCLYEYISYKYGQCELGGFLLKPNQAEDAHLCSPLGLKFYIDNSLAFDSAPIQNLMKIVHASTIELYDIFFNIIIGESFDPSKVKLWRRETMRPQKDIVADLNSLPFLTSKTLDEAVFTISQIRNLTEKQCLFLQNRPKIARCVMLLAGPAYSFSCTRKKVSSEDKYICAFSPKFISDYGGAGLTSLGSANVVHIKRGIGWYEDSEVERRKAFIYQLQKAVKFIDGANGHG